MVPDATTGPGRVGVVGAGTMGAGIAQVALEAGDAVALYDVVPGAVEQARARIADGLTRRASKLGLDDGGAEAWVSARIGRLEGVGTLEAVAQDAFLVIEAAVEDLALKRVVFATLDAQAPTRDDPRDEHQRAAGGLDRRRRVAPVAHRRACTSSTPRRSCRWWRSWSGARPTPARPTGRRRSSSAGARRRSAAPTRPGSSSTASTARSRSSRCDSSRAARPRSRRSTGPCARAGFPQGPFEHIDLIGLDVNLATSTAVHAGLGSPARLAPSALQGRLVAARRLGRKRGVGLLRVRRLGPPGPPGPGLRPPRWQARAAAAGGDREPRQAGPRQRGVLRARGRRGHGGPDRPRAPTWAPPIRRGRSSGPSPRASTRSTRS